MSSESTYQDQRSALMQWLTDEFYNWVRHLPDDKLAYLHENFESAMETGIGAGREACGTITEGDVIRIVPEKGPERVMKVSHVEHHVITLSDPASGTEEGQS